MPLIPDLVHDSKLETRRLQNDTIHTFVEVTHGRRRVPRQEHWKWKRDIGEGGFGRVWLEACTQGNSKGSLRAVKRVRKQFSASRTIDYNRELEAVAKFSHRNVGQILWISCMTTTSYSS